MVYRGRSYRGRLPIRPENWLPIRPQIWLPIRPHIPQFCLRNFSKGFEKKSEKSILKVRKNCLNLGKIFHFLFHFTKGEGCVIEAYKAKKNWRKTRQ